MFGANLINMINLQADAVFLGYFLTAADVGYYSAATGLSKFFGSFPKLYKPSLILPHQNTGARGISGVCKRC